MNEETRLRGARRRRARLGARDRDEMAILTFTVKLLGGAAKRRLTGTTVAYADRRPLADRRNRPHDAVDRAASRSTALELSYLGDRRLDGADGTASLI